MTESYTDEEIKLLREQLRAGVKSARWAIKRRGIKLHPKIASLRAANKQKVK